MSVRRTDAFYVLLTSILGDKRSASCSGQFTAGERAPGKHEIGDYMVRTKLLHLLENERRASSPGTTTLMCQFIEARLGCRDLKWLWERSNSDNEPARQTHTHTHTCSAFLDQPNIMPNSRRCASAVTKQWLVYRKGG